MDVKKGIKKIAALVGTATLMAATVMGAGAMSLDSYPSQFFDGEDFNGVIVVGADAASSDVVGAINIAASLQKAANNMPESVSLGSDKMKFEKSNDNLELGEALGDVKETFTADDSALLLGGKFKTSSGSTDYSQYLQFDDAEGAVQYMENDDDEVADYFYVDDEGLLFEYELEFHSGAESDIDGGVLEDFEDELVPFMGREYSITEAEVSGSELTLTLMGGSEQGVLYEGESKVFTVNGVDYDVKALIISDEQESVKFIVNGEVTGKLYEGDTEKLEDGTEIAVREVMANEGTENGGGDFVEFYLGADKLELTDDYSDNDYSEGVEYNGENVDGAYVKFIAEEDGDDFKLYSVSYMLEADAADSDVFVGEGEVLSSQLDNAEGLFGLDFKYEGLDRGADVEIEFEADSDDAYVLKFTNMRGQDYEMPFVDASDGWTFGTDDENLVFVEGTDIFKKDFFVLTDDDDDDANTYVLKYQSVDEDDSLITFNDLDGDSYEVSYSGGDGDLVLGGHTFAFTVDEESDDFEVQFDHDGNGDIDDGAAKIVTKNGAVLDLGSDNELSGDLSVDLVISEDKFDTEDGDEVLTFSFSESDEEVDADVEGGLDMYNDEDNDDLSTGMSKYGTFVELVDQDNGPAEIKVSVPASQATANLYLVSGDEEEAVSVSARVDVGAAMLDTEVPADWDKNMIVVGGPCANEVAAVLLGSDADNCADGFEEGKAIIKLFEKDGQVALLVAGYSAMDTRRAAKVLAKYDHYDLSGDEVLVEGTTLNDAQVKTVSLE